MMLECINWFSYIKTINVHIIIDDAYSPVLISFKLLNECTVTDDGMLALQNCFNVVIKF